MIIKYPTGLYRDELAEFVSTTNVTYNISNNAPPRSSIIFVQLPAGEKIKTIKPLEKNRALLGDLIFSVSDSNSQNAQTNQRMIEIGTLLDFNAPTAITDATELTLPSAEITHNLNYLDYAGLGFSDTDISNINNAVNASFEIKTNTLNNLKKQYAETYNNIQNTQRRINEITTAISALTLANDTGGLTDYINRLTTDLNANKQSILELNNTLNELSAQIISENDSLRALGALVK